MKTNISIFLLFFLFIFSRKQLLHKKKNDLRYEIMLNKNMLNASMKDIRFFKWYRCFSR